jgi:hypothetical protein
MPPVASQACCSSTVSPASLRMSIGTRWRCAAKMAFITGMYCDARSPETLTTRMREVSATRCWPGVPSESASAALGLSGVREGSTGEWRMVDFEM